MNINNQNNKNSGTGTNNNNSNNLNNVENHSINIGVTTRSTTSVNNNNTQSDIDSLINISNNNDRIQKELSSNTNTTTTTPITPLKFKIRGIEPPPTHQNNTPIQNNTPPPLSQKIISQAQYEEFLKVPKGADIEDIEDDHYDEDLIGLDDNELVVDEEYMDSVEDDNGGNSQLTQSQSQAPPSTLITGNDDDYSNDPTFNFGFGETNSYPTSSFNSSLPDYHSYNIIGSARGITSNIYEEEQPFKKFKSGITEAAPVIDEEADQAGYALLNIPELLKINKEYQDQITKFLLAIEHEQTRNKELLEKAKRYEKIKLPRHKGIPVNSDGGVDEDYVFNPSGRKKANGESRFSGLGEDVHSIHSVYRVDDKKSGVPYFLFQKQVDGVTQSYYPADNPDSTFIRDTKNNMPLFFKTKKWTKKESAILAKGIKDKNFQKKYFRMIEERNSREEFTGGSAVKKTIVASNPSNIDEDELPAIVVIQQICMEGLTRSPLEAYLRWKNCDHPSINKKPFTKDEDKKLLLLAKKYGGHEWVKIATELGTNRTALACIQRYQRSLNSELMKRLWTAEEDEILLNHVKNQIAKAGRIDWQDVTEKLVGRTSHQCLHRWYKTLDPSIRRGRWNEDEDVCLIEAVKLCGRGNWIMIKEHVPGRTDVQCRERYCNVLDPKLVKLEFSTEEDNRLTAVTNEIGIGKWSEISKVIGNRTDNQCWRRWKQLNKGTPQLLEYMKKLDKKKTSCVNNFAGRTKERSALTVDDVLEVENQLKQTTNGIVNNLVESDNNDNVQQQPQQPTTTESLFQSSQPSQPSYIPFRNNTGGSGTITNNFNLENTIITRESNNNSSIPSTPPLSSQYEQYRDNPDADHNDEDFEDDDYDQELRSI